MKKRGMGHTALRFIVCLAYLAALLAGCTNGDNAQGEPQAKSAEGERTPSTLSSRTLQGDPGKFNASSFLMRQFVDFVIEDRTIANAGFEKVQFVGATLKGVTFSGCDFTNTAFAGGEFTDVTFTDCRFTESQFSGVVFNDVTFVGGTIEMYRGKGDRERYVREMFEQLAFVYIHNAGKLVFDAVSLRDATLFAVEGGTIHLKNVTDCSYHPEYGRLIGDGKGVSLHIENCAIAGIDDIARLNAPASVYIADSTIEGGEFSVWSRDENVSAMYVENSRLVGGVEVERFNTVVFTGGTLEGTLNAENVFMRGSSFSGGEKDRYPRLPRVVGEKVYIFGDGADADALYVKSSEELHISDLYMKTLSVSGTIDAFDMHAVKLDTLRFDDGLTLNGGKWERVEIMTQLKAASPGRYAFETVDVHDTTLHGGTVVIDGRSGDSRYSSNEEYILTLRESDAPLALPETAVPTLEELGIQR